MLKTLDISELKVGMYVQDIILKNSSHKVKNKGTVNSARTIALLKKQGVDKVVIKLSHQDDVATPDDKEIEHKTSLEQELSQSCQIYDQATENVKQLFLDTSIGKPLNPGAMLALAKDITESVMRNEHAITILTRIRNKSHYQWEHAINCAVLICGFALHLGLKPNTVKEMTLGALLHDIGSAKVPSAILQKNDSLTTEEFSLIKKHVFWGVELAKNDGFASPIITEMLVNHHERLDGSGYPRGITRDKLSKLSCIIAIIDVYDAMTGDRPHKKGELPLTVLRHLLKQHDLFDQTLVQQFVKYIGVYPVGSLVQLSNEKLAVVLEANRVEPLKPKVKIIYSLKLNKFTKPTDSDLATESYNIIASVQPEDYKIKMNKVIRDLITH